MPIKVLYSIRLAGHPATILSSTDRAYVRLELSGLQQHAKPGEIFFLTHEIQAEPPLSKPEQYLLFVYETRNRQRRYFDRRPIATKEENAANLKEALAYETHLDQWNNRTRAYIDSHPGFENVLKSLPPSDDKARHFAFFQVVEEWRKQWKAYFTYKKLKNKDPAIEAEKRKQCYDFEHAIDNYITKSLRI